MQKINPASTKMTAAGLLTVCLLTYFIAMYLVLLALPSYAQNPRRTIVGTVNYVADGDTIHVLTAEQTKLKVRLYGIDAPETEKSNRRTGEISKPGQSYGEEAKNALAGAISGKEVTLEVMDTDRYKRVVCIVWYQGRNINLEMVSAGLAEAFSEYLKPPYRNTFLLAQREAKIAGHGIWSLPNYERPSDFRRKIKNDE